MAPAPAGGRAGGRVIAPQAVLPFLFVVPPAVAAVHALVRGDVGRFGQAAGVTALFFLAAWLIRRGVKAAGSNRPFPGRTLGALALALATAGAAWFLAGHGMIVSLIFGAGALAGAVLAYGSELAPTRGEGLSADAADARQLVGEARAKLERLARARYRIQGAPEITQKLDSIKGWIEKILAQIEEDPRDLRRARKFLVVYLDGAGEVADKYVALQAKGEGASFAPRLLDLLAEMEKVSAEQHAKLLENDSFDLDVQLEVLSDRLKKEGVA
jgi:5-bromo-4-chloroindolyl phosphate hydrolysis protein